MGRRRKTTQNGGEGGRDYERIVRKWEETSPGGLVEKIGYLEKEREQKPNMKDHDLGRV